MAYSAGKTLHPEEWVNSTLLASVDIRFSAVPAGQSLLSNFQGSNALAIASRP
jgi:hypothetical protein